MSSMTPEVGGGVGGGEVGEGGGWGGRGSMGVELGVGVVGG
jgi:hypothetical protein